VTGFFNVNFEVWSVPLGKLHADNQVQFETWSFL